MGPFGPLRNLALEGCAKGRAVDPRRNHGERTLILANCLGAALQGRRDW
jgi:hypothetical protein